MSKAARPKPKKSVRFSAMAQLDLDIDLAVDAPGWPNHCADLAERAVRAALAAAQNTIAGPLELSILLTDDRTQHELNKKWRNKDKSTNILSFPQLEPFAPLEGLIGDLSLAQETVMGEVTALGVGFDAHFTHLLVHGTLHLCGYDHESDEQALVMEGLETDILAQMGIDNPYAEPARG